MTALSAQITSNPIPAPIDKRGLAVEVRDLVRLPDTRGLRPLTENVNPAGWARVSFVRDAPDGRRFANDSRGRLYLLDGSNPPLTYADVAATFPFAVYNRTTRRSTSRCDRTRIHPLSRTSPCARRRGALSSTVSSTCRCS
jgi:hypothetical protein